MQHRSGKMAKSSPVLWVVVDRRLKKIPSVVRRSSRPIPVITETLLNVMIALLIKLVRGAVKQPYVMYWPTTCRKTKCSELNNGKLTRYIHSKTTAQSITVADSFRSRRTITPLKRLLLFSSYFWYFSYFNYFRASASEIFYFLNIHPFGIIIYYVNGECHSRSITILAVYVLNSSYPVC